MLTRPPRLRLGDRVAVVAPSGPVDEDRLLAGCRVLREWGLDVIVAPHVLDRHPRLDYLAGADVDRAADLQEAWLDPGVSAVFAARGGYGAARIVDLLDWSAMRSAPPKVFVGFSDATVLHEAITARLGLVSLYAPMAATETFASNGAASEALRHMLFEPEQALVLHSEAATGLVGGVARGITVGGCLSVLAATGSGPVAATGDLAGSAARRRGKGRIVLLEDVGEEPYRVDRALTQLVRSGWLSEASGVALGSWRDCGPAAVLEDVFLDRLGGLGVPIVTGLDFGHCRQPITVPLGMSVTLDADAARLILDAPALR